MSTVTVVKKGKEICIASETLTTFGTTKLREGFVTDAEKILKWGDSYVGIVGGVSLSMVLRDIIKKEKKAPNFSNVESIFKYFTKLHKKLKGKYFLNPNEDEDDPVESSQIEIVIVNENGIFGVHSLRDIYHFQKFWAYGSGRRYALGAMNATYDLKSFSAEKIAIEGVKAGITFDDGSSGTIITKVIKVISKV